MLCYHGSDVTVSEPHIIQKNRPLDFGDGFYVTTSKEQAESWAFKVCFRNNSSQQHINVYDLDLLNAEKELRVIRFDKPDAEWLDFICANRSGKDVGDYDVVIGPVADDKVYRVVVQFENGDIDREYAIKSLKAEKLCDQILFHTEKALKYLTYLSTEVTDHEQARF